MTLRFGEFEQYQAQAPATIPLPPNYYEDGGETAVYWLSASGVLVNSHGFNIMIDPLLSIISDDPAIGETAEMLMTAPPILATQVEKLDAVLYTLSFCTKGSEPESATSPASPGGCYNQQCYLSHCRRPLRCWKMQP